MKKLNLTLVVLFMYFAVQAQGVENFDPLKDRDFFFDTLNICGVLLGLYLLSSFLLQLFKTGMSYRIKNRMLDKGTEENIVRQLLLPEKNEGRSYILQWFFMLVAIGIGLLVVGFTRPFGLHSLSILAFSLAAGFGSSYYFTNRRTKTGY